MSDLRADWTLGGGFPGGLDTWRCFSRQIGHLEVGRRADWTLGAFCAPFRPVWGAKCRICPGAAAPSVGFVRRGGPQVSDLCGGAPSVGFARRGGLKVSDLCGAAAPSVGFEWRRILKCRVSSVQHRPYL